MQPVTKGAGRRIRRVRMNEAAGVGHDCWRRMKVERRSIARFRCADPVMVEGGSIDRLAAVAISVDVAALSPSLEPGAEPETAVGTDHRVGFGKAEIVVEIRD